MVGLRDQTIERRGQVCTATVVVGGIWIEILGQRVVTTGYFVGVANSITIHVGRAVSTAYTRGVKLASVAVAVSFRDVRTTALINATGSVADAASIEVPNAIVNIVADAIVVDVGRTCSATLT